MPIASLPGVSSSSPLIPPTPLGARIVSLLAFARRYASGVHRHYAARDVDTSLELGMDMLDHRPIAYLLSLGTYIIHNYQPLHRFDHRERSQHMEYVSTY